MVNAVPTDLLLPLAHSEKFAMNGGTDSLSVELTKQNGFLQS